MQLSLRSREWWLAPPSNEKLTVAVRYLLAELQKFHHVEYVLDSDSTYPGAFVLSAKEAWNNARPKLRSMLRNALRSCSVARHSDIEHFIRLSKLERRWRDNNSYDALRRIWAEVSTRGIGTVVSPYDDSGAESAVCVLVWDDKCLYYLLSTRIMNAAARNVNAGLIWSAIQKAEAFGVVLDLDATPSRLFVSRRFGIKFVARKLVYRISVAWRAAELMKDALKLVLTHGGQVTDLRRRFTDRVTPEWSASPDAHAIRVAE